MTLNSVVNGVRRTTGRFAVITALLSTGACATQATHATQQLARTAAPEVLRVSHAERNLAIAEATGHYSKAMIALARDSKKTPTKLHKYY